jgi:7-carboxy-7-deazaguanine synthase
VKVISNSARAVDTDDSSSSDQFSSETRRMWIAEIFRSKQGEGSLTGTDSAFVRFSGCNLRCWFCDTPYTSWQPEGERLPVGEVVERIASHPTKHIVITGGEPMLSPQLAELCRQLRRRDRHITIETAGTMDQPVECDLMSISPKLANSTPDARQHVRWAALHDARRHQPDVIRRLIESYDYQMKFVVDTPSDLSEIDEYLAQFPQIAAEKVWLMPQGVTSEELDAREHWLGPYCIERGFQLCSRWHIRWYGHRRGT